MNEGGRMLDWLQMRLTRKKHVITDWRKRDVDETYTQEPRNTGNGK